MQGCLALLSLAVPSVPARAGDAADLTSISLEELAQIKVTSVSKTEEPRFRAPAAIHVITADDIRRSGATTFAEALRLAPGVHVARINSSQWGIGMRGFTNRIARSQLALMDGRSLYNPLFAGTYWEAQDTILEDVERIEVVLGPGGTLWGANAVNGIVNIVTKDAESTQGGFVSAGAGNEERGFVRARHGGRIGQKGHYRVYGKYVDRDAAFHRGTGDFDGWHMARGGFRTDWRLKATDRLTVQGDLYSGRAGQRTSVTYYQPPFTRVVEREAPFSGGNLTARWNRSMSGSQLTVLTYYDRTRRSEANFTEVRDTFDVDIQHQLGLGERHDLVWGLAYRSSSGKGQGIETVAFVPPNRTDHIFSAFVYDEIDLASNSVRLGFGTKLERNQYTGFEVQPSVRAVWTPRPRHAVWGAVTRAVRTPSRLERDLQLTASLSPAAPLFARVVGNEDFRAEKVVAYEAGYRVQPADRLSLELSLFRNQYRDLLATEVGRAFAENGRQIVPFLFTNGARGRTSGFELASVARLSSRWTVNAAYAYLDVALEADPGSTDPSQAAAEGVSPRHTVRAQSSWTLAHSVDLDVSFRWVDRLRSQSVPAYSAVDARLGWFVVPRLELAVVGQSLLTPHHPESGAPQNRTDIERSIYGEIRWLW